MSRVKRGLVAKRYRKKVLKFNSGFQGSHSTLFRTAKQQNMRALRYAYFDRRKRKNQFRSLWINRINAMARRNSSCYSRFIKTLKMNKVYINRKILAQLCISTENPFQTLLTTV